MLAEKLKKFQAFFEYTYEKKISKFHFNVGEVTSFNNLLCLIKKIMRKVPLRAVIYEFSYMPPTMQILLAKDKNDVKDLDKPLCLIYSENGRPFETDKSTSAKRFYEGKRLFPSEIQ